MYIFFYNYYVLYYVTKKQKNPFKVPLKYVYIIINVTKNQLILYLYIINNIKYD